MDTAQFILEVINSFGMRGVSPSYAKRVHSFFVQNNENRIETLAAAAQLIPSPASQIELYAVSTAYVWAGAKYRLQAIEMLERLLEVGGCWEEELTNAIRSDRSTSTRTAAIADTYTSLGGAYEGEYMFEKAADAYSKAVNLWPSAPHNHIKLAVVYSKMNDLDRAIMCLEHARIHARDAIDCQAIEKYLSDMKAKKAKGYVYKARKQQGLIHQ